MTVEITSATWTSVNSIHKKIGIVVSDYNLNITSKLRDAAVMTLRQGGIADDSILIVVVPGAWELPFATQRFLENDAVDGVIALGAVIRGETTHDVHINRSVSSALMQLSLDHRKPVAFGLLTVLSLEQAIQRSGGNKGNKGEECASALLACLRLGESMDQFNMDGNS